MLHVIDREADSVDYFRKWDAAGFKFLVGPMIAACSGPVSLFS